MAPLEEAVAAAWWREVNADKISREERRVEAALEAAMSAHQRVSRRGIVLDALASGPKTRSELQELLCLSPTQSGTTLVRMINAGDVVVQPVKGRRRKFVYALAR